MTTPLVIAFTPNYIVPAAVTLKSILDSSSEEAGYEVICLVSEEIPQKQKKMLEGMAEGRMKFNYIKLKGSLEGYYVDPRYSEAASYRLLLPELLPWYDKVLYIDCDIIVRNDLARLFNSTELGDNLLGVIYEAPIEEQSKRWEAIGCDPKHYFNSGFLLMNLKKMREDGTSARLIEALNVEYLEFPDQDALNKICQGRVLALPPYCNSIRTFYLPQYKSDFLKQYSEADWQDVQKHGNIHYTGGKPWNLFTVQFGHWWQTYDSLPADIKNELKPSGKVKAIWRIYRTGFGRLCIDKAQAIYRKLKG